MTISFTVLGVAQTAGSKRSFVPLDKKTKEPFRRPNGGIVVSTVDDNPKGRDWKNAVACSAREVYQGELLSGPLNVTMRFYRPRPTSHFGKHGLNKTGLQAIAPATRPDVLKLARCCEDALNGVLYGDDAQIVEEHLYKHWGEPARMEIEIEALQEHAPVLFEVQKKAEAIEAIGF